VEDVKFCEEVMRLPDAKEFVSQCYNAFERIVGFAPSDGSVFMKTDFDGEFFRTAISLVAKDLKFALSQRAHSPFVALERAVREALEKTKLWSIHRIHPIPKGDL
jgi:hypothetical protein